MTTDPHQRCTCGFRRFRERRIKTEEDIQRWMFFDNFKGGGFGSTPFGTFFGAGVDGLWGLFDSTLKVTVQEVVCENCQRIRLSKNLGGIAVFASYISGGWFYVVASDVGRPITCFDLKFEGPETFVVPLELALGAIPPIFADPPPMTSPTLPSGAPTVDTQLRGRIPDVPETANYTVSVVDRCAGTETPLVTVLLEAPPMIITPDQADINGAPDFWLRQRLLFPTQIASGSTRGIPLDYCEAVLEFDARFGTLPDSQSWSHEAGAGTGAPSDYSLVEGGVMRAGTPGATNPSYWEKAITVSSAPSVVNYYAAYLWETDTAGSGFGEGLDFQALFAASAGAYSGLRTTHRDGVYYATALDSSAETAGFGGEYDVNGWNYAAGETDGTDEHSYLNGFLGVTSGLFGTQPGPAPGDEIRARFGDVVGEGVTAYIRNFVVSTPGRFIRAHFKASAPVSDPVLRLYLIGDLPASGDLTARILVRYGSGTATPYALPATIAEQTLNLVDANTVYELAFNLSGLTANLPFLFTVERNWVHGDDTRQSTVWLLQATVRSS